MCYAACDVVRWNPHYLGPAALNRAWTLVADERDTAGVARLAVVAGDAGCHACHPGYVTSERLAEIRGDAAGTKYRDNLSYPELKESNYMVGEKQIFFLPPDFTWHQMRAGTSSAELFETTRLSPSDD